MEIVDVCFPVRGKSLPVDHGFALYSAVCRVCPHLHEDENAGVGLIRGRYQGDGKLDLNRVSSVRLRIPADSIPAYLDLTGKRLEVGGHQIVLGTPSIIRLTPRVAHYSHIVTTRNGNDEERFKSALKTQMEMMGINGTLHVGNRKTFKLHGKHIVGYSLLVTGLTAEESITLQEKGLGGRRKMGCGIFIGIR